MLTFVKVQKSYWRRRTSQSLFANKGRNYRPIFDGIMQSNKQANPLWQIHPQTVTTSQFT